MKESAERERYTKFTCGVLSPSLPQFHGDRYTASSLEVQAHDNLGMLQC